MQNKEIEQAIQGISNLADAHSIHSYIEELEDKVDELEEENNDLQHEIDTLNERD